MSLQARPPGHLVGEGRGNCSARCNSTSSPWGGFSCSRSNRGRQGEAAGKAETRPEGASGGQGSWVSSVFLPPRHLTRGLQTAAAENAF